MRPRVGFYSAACILAYLYMNMSASRGKLRLRGIRVSFIVSPTVRCSTAKRHTGKGGGKREGEGGEELEASRPPVETLSSAYCNGFTNYGYGGAVIELRPDRPGWRRSEDEKNLQKIDFADLLAVLN
jgi:hypothetical protein